MSSRNAADRRRGRIGSAHHRGQDLLNVAAMNPVRCADEPNRAEFSAAHAAESAQPRRPGRRASPSMSHSWEWCELMKDVAPSARAGRIRVPPPPGPSARSENMRANRRRDTAPERALRSALHARGARFRVDRPVRLPGMRPIRPDIVFTRRRVAVFVDSCFWHGCPQHGHTPSANLHYWGPKLARNRQRDDEQTAAFEAAGWLVVRVWEHESIEIAAGRVLKALAQR